MRTFIVLLYIAAIIGIAINSQRGSNKIKSVSDMNLGGRKQNWFTTGASAAASGCSAYAFIGMAGISYTVGISMLWYSVLATIWSWGVFYVLGRRLRRLSVKTGTTTIVDYLSARFEDENGSLRLVATIWIVIFMVAYVTTNFSALAKAFQSFLGWPFLVGLLVGAAVAAFYTIISGFRGSVLIDTMQSVVMLLGSVVSVAFVLNRAGGLTPLLNLAALEDPNLVTVTGDKSGIAFVMFLVGWLGSGIMGLGNPHVSVKPMGMENDEDMRQAGIWSYIINVMVMYCSVFVGLAARVWITDLQDPDLAYGIIVGDLMGPIMGGLVIAGIIAATMSTVGAQLLVAGSEISTNVMRWRKEEDGRVVVAFTRVCLVVVAIIGIIFALNTSELVFYMSLFAWGGLGASIGPILILSLYWKETTKEGAIAGIIVGGVTVVIWYLVPSLSALIYEGVPGFVFSLLAIIIVSNFTKAPEGAEDLIEYSKQTNV